MLCYYRRRLLSNRQAHAATPKATDADVVTMPANVHVSDDCCKAPYSAKGIVTDG